MKRSKEEIRVERALQMLKLEFHHLGVVVTKTARNIEKLACSFKGNMAHGPQKKRVWR